MAAHAQAVSNFEATIDKLTGGDGGETGGGRDKTSFKRGRRYSLANAYLSLDAKVHEASRLGKGLLSNMLLEAGATIRRVLVYSSGGAHDTPPRLRSSYRTTTTTSTADAHHATATTIRR